MFLDRLRGAGLTGSLTERGTVRVAPASVLSDVQRSFLRERREDVVAELQAEAANDAAGVWAVSVVTPATAEALERIVPARLEAYVALLERQGCRVEPRTLARARRDAAERLGYRSLAAARAALGEEALVRAAELLDAWTAELADPDPFAPDALDTQPTDVATKAPVRTGEPSEESPAPQAPPNVPDAALARGQRLLERLRWTGRRVYLEPNGALAIRPRLGSADPFGQDVAAHPNSIVRALRFEAEGAGADEGCER